MDNSNKTVNEKLNNETRNIFEGFALFMNGVWGNDNGTKGLNSFLNSDNEILKNKEE